MTTAIKLPKSKQNNNIGLCKLTTLKKTAQAIKNGTDSVKVARQFLANPNRLSDAFLALHAKGLKKRFLSKKTIAPICFISRQFLTDVYTDFYNRLFSEAGLITFSI